MRILIGADIVPTDKNIGLFNNGDAEELIGKEILNEFKRADFKILNLEVPLSNIQNPIPKTGPNLIAPESTIKGIKEIGPNLVTLANNHILDQGRHGLETTIKLLTQNKIGFVGAGTNLEDACRPYLFEKDNIKFAIYACAEHEFSIATETMCGANPFDPLESLDHIAGIKPHVDYLIVLYHGGKEHYRYPSPELQRICRKIIDKGADLVVTQHSHCVGCEEKWRHGTIIYGQGNFLFDGSDIECWQSGLLVSVNVTKITQDIKIEYIPLQKYSHTVRLAQNDTILRGFFSRSKEIQQNGFVQMEYEHFAKTMIPNYKNAFGGRFRQSFLFRALNKVSSHKLAERLNGFSYNNHMSLILENFIGCEAHRELLLKGLSASRRD